MTRRTAIPAWVPAALAAALFAGLYGLWVRPTQARIAAAEEQLRQARQQAGSLEVQIQRDRAVPPVPLPVTKAAFDRLWPDVVARAQAAGYALQGVTFSAAPPLPSPGPSEGGAAAGAATPLEITARFAGPYLPLDEALRRMQSVLPLWSWRSIHVSAQQGVQGGAELSVAVDGVVPVEGQIAGPRGTVPRTPAPAPPPPPPGSQP